jgi:hypothetical protein
MMKFSIDEKKGRGRASGQAYAKTTDQHALLYRRSTRTIKRWKAAGRSAGDPPPLDDLATMPAWHLRMSKPKPSGPPELVQTERKDTQCHVRYKKPLSFYAIIYNLHPRTLKRWIRRGKQRGDAVPLDDRQKFLQWLTRHVGTVRGRHAPRLRDHSPWLIPPEE